MRGTEDYAGFRKEYLPREKVIREEMEDALKRCHYPWERTECLDAYFLLMKGLRDEVQQKHGIEGIIWKLKER